MASTLASSALLGRRRLLGRLNRHRTVYSNGEWVVPLLPGRSCNCEAKDESGSAVLSTVSKAATTAANEWYLVAPAQLVRK